jgi:hypothetical protein
MSCFARASRQEFVIEGKGSRSARIGAFHIGVNDEAGTLRCSDLLSVAARSLFPL